MIRGTFALSSHWSRYWLLLPRSLTSRYYITRGKSYDLLSGLLGIAFSSPRRWKHHYVGSCLMLWLSWRENIQGVTPLLLDLNCTKLRFSSPEFWRITSQEHLMAWSSQMRLHEFYLSFCTTQRLSPFKSRVTTFSSWILGFCPLTIQDL